jgi:hypothetical protein
MIRDETSVHSDTNYYQQQNVLKVMKFTEEFQFKIDGFLNLVRISEAGIFMPNYIGVK